jgi:acetoin utilization protein AcuC
MNNITSVPPTPSASSAVIQERISSIGQLGISYSDDYLIWQLGEGDGSHPTNPMRAQLATGLLVAELPRAVSVSDPTAVDRHSVRAAIDSVHEAGFVSRVIDEGIDLQWTGRRPEMGQTAMTMFAGTMVLTQAMIARDIMVGFNPQGAKHHAASDGSSGFCVFNDMAWAAREFAAAGFRPLYLDWDIHAGDGTQSMLFDTEIPTLSIHNGAAFPFDGMTRDLSLAGTRHTSHHDANHAYNWCIEDTDGDDAFAWAIGEAVSVIDDYRPDVILVAAGADGMGGANDLGMRNTYTFAGFQHAALAVAEAATRWSNGRVLIGGAGGYQPLTHTPRVWANVVETIYLEVNR